MTESNKRYYTNSDVKYEYDYPFCPLCGGKIKHPYIGTVTDAQMEEDSHSCIWGEVQDEHNYTLGYVPYCKNIHPYTLDEEDNKYVHYDLVELVNCWDMTLDEKVDKVTTYIMHLFREDEVKKEDIVFNITDEHINSITLSKPIDSLTINIEMDNDGNINFSKAK